MYYMYVHVLCTCTILCSVHYLFHSVSCYSGRELDQRGRQYVADSHRTVQLYPHRGVPRYHWTQATGAQE